MDDIDLIERNPAAKRGAMDIARKLGMLVFCGVPAIIGGGIVYHFFGTMASIFVYEAILLVAIGAILAAR